MHIHQGFDQFYHKIGALACRVVTSNGVFEGLAQNYQLDSFTGLASKLGLLRVVRRLAEGFLEVWPQNHPTACVTDLGHTTGACHGVRRQMQVFMWFDYKTTQAAGFTV